MHPLTQYLQSCTGSVDHRYVRKSMPLCPNIVAFLPNCSCFSYADFSNTTVHISKTFRLHIQQTLVIGHSIPPAQSPENLLQRGARHCAGRSSIPAALSDHCTAAPDANTSHISKFRCRKPLKDELPCSCSISQPFAKRSSRQLQDGHGQM